MYKRQRLDDNGPGQNECMEVEVPSSDDKLDLIQRLGHSNPRILQLLQDIMPTNQVELVEQSSHPLGVSPIGNYRKKIDGQELLELASGIELADNQAKYKITNQLEMIAQQINFLRQQAVRVVKEGQESLSLNHVPCNFLKVPGNTYYIYRKPSGQAYFSVLSPMDWHEKPPHDYCGSYIYGHDRTWSRSPEKFNHLLHNSIL